MNRRRLRHDPADGGATEGAEPLSLAVPVELVEAIASRVANLLVERLPSRPEPYLDVEEAATYIAARPARIYDLVERRAVAVHRDGRRLLFRCSDLDAYLRREEAQ